MTRLILDKPRKPKLVLDEPGPKLVLEETALPFAPPFGGPYAVPQREPVERKSIGEAAKHGYRRAGVRMVKGIAGKAKAVGELLSPEKEAKTLFPMTRDITGLVSKISRLKEGEPLVFPLKKTKPEIAIPPAGRIAFPVGVYLKEKYAEESREWGDMMLTGVNEYYRTHPEEAIQIAPNLGYLRTLKEYVTKPENLLQGLIESGPLVLEGVLGNIVAGPPGGIFMMATPIAGETYADAREQGTEPLPALAQSILTGGGEAVIEQWTLGKKLGLFRNFKTMVSRGLPKVLWEGTKLFFRGTAEEGSQEFNRNFWQWVFTDRSQAWLENISESAAAGGPMELVMGGAFAGAGYAGSMIPNNQKKQRISKIRTTINQSPEFSPEQKTEINKELDIVSEDIDSGVYDKIQEEVATEEKPVAAVKPSETPIRAPQPAAEAITPPVKGKSAAPEAQVTKPAEAEKVEKEIKPTKRRVLIKDVENQILKDGAYQAVADGLQDMVQEMHPGPYYVEPRFRAEIEDVTGKPGQKGYLAVLHKKFFFKREGQLHGVSWDEIASRHGITDLGTFVERVRANVEAKTGKGIVNEKALEGAISEPYAELLAMKREMLKNNYSPTEINDTIEQWLKDKQEDGLEITREGIADQFIKTEEKDYVEKKPDILPEVERKGRQAKARLDPEQAAIHKAKIVARKLKAPAYVYEKQGRFVVSKNPPVSGPYQKIEPTKPREIVSKIVQEKGITQKDKAFRRAELAAKKLKRDSYVYKNLKGRFITSPKKPITDHYIISPEGKSVFIKGPTMANVGQKVYIYEVAENKGLMRNNKPTQSFYKFAKSITGKTNVELMTEEEAATFAEMMNALVTDYRGIARIPNTRDIITKELADKIGKFKNIGFLERFRPSHRVFQKIGLKKMVFESAFEAEVASYEELMEFREEAHKYQKLVGKDKETARRLFNAIDNPGSVKLTENEQKVVKWAKGHYDKWADKLGLTPEQRRKNYITHIFEKEISSILKEVHGQLDPDLLRALDFITPKTIFNPFLQRRLGREVGLKRDLWVALEAYEARALKKFYYEPLIKRIRVYEKYLPPNSARYLRNFITRITGRPLVIDKEINQTLKEVAQSLNKLPGGKLISPYLTKGNASGMMAYNFTGILYESWLGLRPAAAIKNLSQHGLILAEVGPKAFYQAMTASKKVRKALIPNSKVLRSRKLGYIPGIDETFINSLDNKRRKITMAMFRAADKKNVSDAFLAGYYEAKNNGMSDDWAFKRGDEVAWKTEWLYTKLSGAQAAQSGIGRVLSVLTTWPENWAELMNDWIKARPSEVYSEYTKETGKKIGPTNWIARRKSLWTYLALVSLAMLIHKKTPFKAVYYTGWTSLGALADIASGKLAGLSVPGMIADLVVGLATLDKRRIKRAWNDMKRFVVIGKELHDIISGKKDWINLFLYMDAKPTGERPTRAKRQTRESR